MYSSICCFFPSTEPDPDSSQSSLNQTLHPSGLTFPDLQGLNNFIRRLYLHFAVSLYPPSGEAWPSTASKPEDTRTTSGANSLAIGMTTVLQQHGDDNVCIYRKDLARDGHFSERTYDTDRRRCLKTSAHAFGFRLAGLQGKAGPRRSFPRSGALKTMMQGRRGDG